MKENNEHFYIFNNGQYVLFQEYIKVKYARCSIDTYTSDYNLKESVVKQLDELIRKYIKYTKKHTSYGIGETYLSVPDILIPEYNKLKKDFLLIVKNPDNYVYIDINR